MVGILPSNIIKNTFVVSSPHVSRSNFQKILWKPTTAQSYFGRPDVSINSQYDQTGFLVRTMWMRGIIILNVDMNICCDPPRELAFKQIPLKILLQNMLHKKQPPPTLQFEGTTFLSAKILHRNVSNGKTLLTSHYAGWFMGGPEFMVDEIFPQKNITG